MSIIDLHQINTQIKSKLFEITYKIECFNLSGNADINKYAEIYFKNLLNIIYKKKKWLFERADKINQDTYDLFDNKNRICIQITSNCRQAKKDSTINNFIKNQKTDFDCLIILFLSKTKPTKNNLEINFKYLDFSIIEFANLIENQCSQTEILQIRDILYRKLELPNISKLKIENKTIKQIEKDFKRNRKVEIELHKELLIHNYWEKIDRQTLTKYPNCKFKDSRFILHSIQDNTYPNMIEESAWCRTYMYDFYERGILIWVDGFQNLTVIFNNKNDEWYIRNFYDNSKLSNDYVEVQVRVLGKLPFENIIDYKSHDDYYNDYHLFCKYIGIDETPYEEMIYLVESEKDIFTIELDKLKMITS